MAQPLQHSSTVGVFNTFEFDNRTVTAQSPFVIQPHHRLDRQTLTAKERISIPPTACPRALPWSSIFTISWALLLTQYGGSGTINLDVHSIKAGMVTKTRQTVTMDVSPDRNLGDLVDSLQDAHVETKASETNPCRLETDESLHCTKASLMLSNPELTGPTGLDEDEVLRLVVMPDACGTRYLCHVDYTSALGSGDIAIRVMQQFAHIACQIVSAPAAYTIRQLDLLSTADRITLQQWTTQTFAPVSACLHHLAMVQAQKQPSAPAVSAWDGDLSYGELNTLSDELAALLVRDGLRKGVIVPLLFEKSKWTVVSVLAVLKAGGVCVGLCTSHPESYVRATLEQIEADRVLCSSSQVHRLEGMNYTPWIIPHALKRGPEGLSGSGLNGYTVQSHPLDLAYAIFTSGSTGKPKGVLLTHEAIATSTHYHGMAVNVKSTSRILQFSSYAFDMSVIETWYALARGGCLCIPSESQRLWALPTFIREHRASWAFFTPTMLRTYQPDDLSGLDTIVLGGENVTLDLVLRWQGHVRLFNLWGPAESAGAAGCEILAGSWIPGTFGPGAGCTLWIVRPEDSDQLAAIGTIGEVLIEGHTVAQGYLNDPIRTEQVFIAPPVWRSQFPSHIQGRFYKTGDLARYNPDGTVCYVSRKDTMVKINGQRVDLDAVEIAIRTLQPECKVAVDAVVLEGRNGRTDPVLLAFIETAAGIEWTGDAFVPTEARSIRDFPEYKRQTAYLRDQLSRSLPRFMAPTFFVPLTRLPVGATGKVDKKRLRTSLARMSYTSLAAWFSQEAGSSPSSDTSPLDDGDVRCHPRRPQSEAEHTLVDIVSTILGTDSSTVDMDASFRQLGGDSVSAIQLVRLLAERGVALSLQGILTADWSLTDLAASIHSARQTAPSLAPPFSLLAPAEDIGELMQSAAQQCQIAESEIVDMYPCTSMQEGLLSLTSALASSAYIDQFLFHLAPHVVLDHVKAAWDRVVERISILRTRIMQTNTGRSYQVVTRSVLPWVQYESLESLTAMENAPEMGFGSPLIRLCFVKGQSHIIAVTLHHAIYDGWTLSLLLRLVEQTYQGENLSVEPLPFSLFVQHLQQQQNNTSVRMEDFWREEMADVQPMAFPSYPTTDYYPRATTSVRQIIAAPPLPPSSGTQASPTVRLSLVWALFLALYGGVDDVVFGNVVDGRRVSLPGIEVLAGPTISTVPVRVRLQREMTIRDATQQIQDSMTRTVPFEHTGLQHIARTGPGPALACQFRTLLVVQSDPERFDSSILGRVEARLAGMQGFPGYALILICRPSRGSWTLELLTDENLVSARQGSRMLDQLAHLLHELGCEDRRLGEVNLLCPADQDQLRQWHAEVPEPQDCCLHDMFSLVARASPQRTAISAWDGDLTYSQLDQLSTVMAAELQIKYTPDDNRAVCLLFPRSRWVVVAILAAMKAGRPFVILDTNQSLSHQKKLCEKARAAQVLASETTAPKAKCLVNSVYIAGPGLMETRDPGAHSKSKPGNQVKSKDIAYIVFTSGSTGEPKGVMVEHRQFAAAAVAQGKRLHIKPDSRVLHLSSYSFDSFAVEILTTLCAGACVCIPSDEETLYEISRAVNRFQSTWMVTTPSMLRLINKDEVPSLRTLVAVGESMAPSQAEEWASRLQLLCGYGPTECCTGASVQLINPEAVDVRNIGTGMGARLWLVHKDDHHSLVPVGAIGEIVIQGPIVCRGYLDDPARSQEVFLDGADWASLVGSAPGDRLYKTGDLGRYNEDGTCTFLGRKSQQIKLHGQRLDLPVVEDNLHRVLDGGCTAIAAAIRPSDSQAHPVLVAMIHTGATADSVCAESAPFCQHSPTFAAQARRAQDALHRGLPAVMVPSLFLQLFHLPLLASGKVNRQALQDAASALTPQELFALGRLGADGRDEALNNSEEVAWTLSKWLADITKKNFHPVTTARQELQNAKKEQQGEHQIIGRNVTPARLGLDSIDMVAFARLIVRDFGLRIPATVLFQTSLTVRKIEEMIASQSDRLPLPASPDAEEPAAWWRDYQRLTAELAQLPKPPTTLCNDPAEHHQPSSRLRRVFLTGGTGFLGTHVLHQLVVNPDVDSVTVLVRGHSLVHAMARIIQSARLAQWWRNEYQRVIRVWLGDLGRPQLGLSDDQWAILCGQSPGRGEPFDAIIHNGATVHWVLDYSSMQASNVQSTFELLRALSYNPLPIAFTYISALRPGDTGIPAAEEARDSLSTEVGYSQTKLVSEMLIQQYAKSHGRPGMFLSVVRPGLMMGSVADGIANVDDVTWRTVSAAISIRGYNGQEDDSWIYIAPVDWIATVVVHETARGTAATGEVNLVTIADGLYVKDFWQAIVQATASPLLPMDGAQWLAEVQKSIHTMGHQHPLGPVIDFFQATSGCIGSVLGTGKKPQVEQQQQLSSSVKSIIWMTVLRNAQYLTSLGYWGTTINSNALDSPSAASVFRRGGVGVS